jgi:hypothetical protein
VNWQKEKIRESYSAVIFFAAGSAILDTSIAFQVIFVQERPDDWPKAFQWLGSAIFPILERL